jgi:hypothetical protein
MCHNYACLGMLAKRIEQRANQLEKVKQGLQMPLLLYAFFLAALLVDIGGAFGLKYLASAVLIIYLVATFFTNRIRLPSSFLVLEGGLFVIAPVFFLILAIAVFSVEPVTAVGGVTAFATWLLFPILLLIRPKERIISIFTAALFCGAIFIIAMFIIIFTMHFLGHEEFITRIYIFTSEYRLGYFGRNPLGGNAPFFFPNVYPRWTLLLIPAAILLFHGNMKKFIIVILATLLTTSTTAILFLLLGVFWASFGSLKISNLYIKRYTILLLLLLLGISVIYLLDYGYIIKFVESKLEDSTSTSIKLGHITSILDLISRDMGTLLFGMGVGSSFWSTGVDQVVSNVEVSHFNLMREFGLPYAIAFFSYVLLLFAKLCQLRDESGRLLSIGLIVLFVAAGTNPLLISPVFFLILVVSRAYITLTARERQAGSKLDSISEGVCWTGEKSGGVTIHVQWLAISSATHG